MTQRVLDDAKEQLAAVEGGIAVLQAKYRDCLAKKEELDNKYQLCETRLVQADKVRGTDKIRQDNTALIPTDKIQYHGSTKSS